MTRAFDATPPSGASDLNTHLVSLSGSGRGEYWRVALTTFTSAPIVGHGAGTFGRLWLIKRPDTLNVQDAHSLYLETLSELGIVGLALLLAVLAVPLVAARRVLRTPYIPALTAAYIAFLVVLDISGNVFTVLPSLTRTPWDLGTTNGANARLKPSEELQLVNSSGKMIGAPSAPDSDTDGFGNCAWATSCSAPSS